MAWQATGWAFEAPIDNPGCKFVLVALCERATSETGKPPWTCYPSINSIGEYTAQKYRTIQRHLDWLEENGYLTRTQRMQAKGRKGCFDFVINPSKWTTGQYGHRPENAPEVAEIGQTEPIKGTSQSLVERAPDPFDAFWSIYPLKKAKDAARTAYHKALKRIGSPSAADVIQDGVRCYIAEIERTGAYVKHPATWLNAGCWDDEPEQRRPENGRQPTSAAQQRTDAMHAGFVAVARRSGRRWGFPAAGAPEQDPEG